MGATQWNGSTRCRRNPKPCAIRPGAEAATARWRRLGARFWPLTIGQYLALLFLVIAVPLSALAFLATDEVAGADRNASRAALMASTRLVTLIDRVELMPNTLRLILHLTQLLPRDATRADAASLTLACEFPLCMKRRGVEMRLVIEGPTAGTTKTDPVLFREIARGYRCFRASGGVTSFSQLSVQEGIDERYVRRVLPLAFLAPEIVQTILAGKQPLDLTAKRLIRTIDLPLDWQTQKQVLGFR